MNTVNEPLSGNQFFLSWRSRPFTKFMVFSLLTLLLDSGFDLSTLLDWKLSDVLVILLCQLSVVLGTLAGMMSGEAVFRLWRNARVRWVRP